MIEQMNIPKSETNKSIEQAQSEMQKNLALSIFNASLLEDALNTSEVKIAELEQRVTALQG